jgi:TolA-binding protein
MEGSKTTKKIVLMAVSLGTGGMIIASLSPVWDLAKSPPPLTKTSSSSQDAQVAAKENEFLAVLKKNPKDPKAIEGMEQVVEYYGHTGNKQKTVESLEKLLAAAPEAKRTKEYAKVLDAIKKSPATGKK